MGFLYQLSKVNLKNYNPYGVVERLKQLLQDAHGQPMTTQRLAQLVNAAESVVQANLEDEFSNGTLEHAVNDRGDHEWRWPSGPAPRGWGE